MVREAGNRPPGDGYGSLYIDPVLPVASRNQLRHSGDLQ